MKEYLKVSIELCRHCHGRGSVAVNEGEKFPTVDTAVEGVCPICAGSGLVKKRKHITVELEPFAGFLKGN